MGIRAGRRVSFGLPGGDDGLNMLGEHGRCRPPGIIPGAVGATRGSSGTAPSAPSDSPENGGTPGQSGLTRGSALCAREELNLHALVGHWHLKPARLPFRHSRSAAVGGSETIAQRRGRPAIHPGRRPASRAASIADGRRAIPPVRRRRTAPRGALTPETRGAPGSGTGPGPGAKNQVIHRWITVGHLASVKKWPCHLGFRGGPAGPAPRAPHPPAGRRRGEVR